MVFRKKRFRRKTKRVGKAVKRYVKRKFDSMIENKVFYSQAQPTLLNTIDYIVLNTIAQGTNNTDRIGNRIRMKILRLRLSFENVLLTLPCWIRVFVLLDKQPNGALPTTTQLLFNTTGGNTYITNFNVNGRKRYKILFDRTLDISVQGGGTDVESQHHIIKNIRLKDTVTVYNSNAATTAAINTNALYLCAMTNIGANAVMRYDQVMEFEDA